MTTAEARFVGIEARELAWRPSDLADGCGDGLKYVIPLIAEQRGVYAYTEYVWTADLAKTKTAGD